MDAPLPRMRVAVLGAGSWGTALAALASGQADTWLWARDPDTARALQQQRRNPRYLADIPLPDTLHATHDFDRAVAHAVGDGATPGLIILGVPVAGMTDACQRLARSLGGRPRPALGVIWTCKGFHPDTGQLPHEIAADILQELAGAGLGVLSGPSFAREVAQGLPVALTVASTMTPAARATVAALHGGNARIYTSHDIKGVEVGGALKNVMAIACGISDGLRLGDNARAALITRGLAEIQRLGLALGGQADTFSGLTGLGDLVLTATGNQSRNRQVGLAVGEGRRLDDILADGMTAEGVRCARAVLAMGRRLSVDLPITEAVCDVLFGGLAPREAVAALLSRESRPEH